MAPKMRVRRRWQTELSNERSMENLTPFKSAPPLLSPPNNTQQSEPRKLQRARPRRSLSHEFHHCSLQPILLLECHPVFVQPVKDYVRKQWRSFRITRRNDSSNSALRERNGKHVERPSAVSRTSNEPAQLFQHSQLTTTVQGSGSPLGIPSTIRKPSPSTSPKILSAPPTTDVSPSSRVHSPHKASTESVLQIIKDRHPSQQPEKREAIDEMSYFPRPGQFPLHSCAMPDFAQTRPNRVSSSGTTVFTPPIIKSASPNSKNLVSTESPSSSGLSQGRPAFL
ncbi:hypothetical protein MMC28_001056 [Mycoblastus sanguinarius]|nr:hypothetical protein [Mycoblastus sanguinarius]